MKCVCDKERSFVFCFFIGVQQHLQGLCSGAGGGGIFDLRNTQEGFYLLILLFYFIYFYFIFFYSFTQKQPDA